MWGDFMLLPNHLYKPTVDHNHHPASAVTAATAIGLSTNPILNPTLCAAAAAATSNGTVVNSNGNSGVNCNSNLFAHAQQTQSILPTLHAMASNVPLNKLYLPQAGPTMTAIPQLTLATAAAAAAISNNSLHHLQQQQQQQQHQQQQQQQQQQHTQQQLTPQSAAMMTPTCTSTGQENTTNHFHIFVGDIAPEIETGFLRDKFSVFGRVTECKIIKDMHTQKPKGYGFVAYATKEEAEEALTKMNGRFLGSRQIRTNWAIRRPPQPPGKDQKPLDYHEVFAASSESNCTIYVGGITIGLNEELLRDAFKDFGEILEVRIFKEKGYAFVRFDSHEGATQAIIKMHGRDVGSQPCKCSWGKESNDQKDGTQNSTTNPFSFYVNPIGYPYSLLTQPIPDLNAASNYAVSLNNLQNLNGQDFSSYMMGTAAVPTHSQLNNSNLGTLNGLINQFSAARGVDWYEFLNQVSDRRMCGEIDVHTNNYYSL